MMQPPTSAVADDLAPVSTTEGGDWVTAARQLTPTNAHLIKNCLQAAGIEAMVADANLVQANAFMMNAVGGVRVLVQQGALAEATAVLRQYEAGEFALEPAAPQKALSQAPGPLWGPDFAFWLGLSLTPVFSCTLHWINAVTLGDRPAQRRAIGWWAASVLVTGASLLWVTSSQWHWSAGLSAAALAMPFTGLWYAVAGIQQSKTITERFGLRCPKRPTWWLGLLTLVGLVLIGSLAAAFDPRA
jgi:hypothetical protein